MLIAFHKPFGVLSQFTGDLPRQGASTADDLPNRTLAEFGFPKKVYPIGRLDADSEGLLFLSDEPEWNEKLLHPRHAHEREYMAQVEKIPTPESLQKLEKGLSDSMPENSALPRMDSGTAAGGSVGRESLES